MQTAISWEFQMMMLHPLKEPKFELQDPFRTAVRGEP